MQLLQELGKHLMARRKELGLSRGELAKRSGVSTRFLVEVESGRGNISISRLATICNCLQLSLASLFASLPSGKECNKIALIGLRGAGKTTIGKKVASKLHCKFVELDEWIEKTAGLTLQNIFEVHGEEYYRQLELDGLRHFLQSPEPMVIAVAGGIVTREETYTLLRQHCLTIWLKADPQDHWNRVLQQDPRPMTNYPNAMQQLKDILEKRQSLYSMADFQVDTSARGISDSVQHILNQTNQLNRQDAKSPR